MPFEMPDVNQLRTESDVEQKFIYPLLTAEMPSGMGFRAEDIRTKADIRSFSIDKGNKSKLYYPDYIIAIDGLPLMVVEAKVPGSDLKEAFREARLYANELNAAYTSNLNPVSLIIATDGLTVYAGSVDHIMPSLVLNSDEIRPYSAKMADVIEKYGRRALQALYDRFVPRHRPQRLYKPRRLVGGSATQREEVSLNTFGATISADFSHIFNPINHEDRVRVAREGYISSKRRERYIEPIDRIIRAATPASVTASRTLEDSQKPKEIIKILRDARKLEQQVLLIVGSAGAGKTTFVDHLQEVALPKEIRQSTVWVRINMNPAPISRSEIYDWLRREILSGIAIANPDVDMDDLDIIKAIHAPEVVAFRKGIGRLFEHDKAAWGIKLAEKLEASINDLHKHTIATARYFGSQSNKLLVIVLDNCDKRLRDEQLLMFEAAQWLQREFTGLVVLPLREETYDNHRDEPPLDTALKDLVFRIEPPLFQAVLQSRVQMALRSITERSSKMLRYDLPNGMYVEYPVRDQAYYLSSIMKSIFEYGLQVRRLIIGLSGRNMRRALEIFLEFCTSGHIGEDEFLKIRQSQGQYVLPLSLVTTVLLRLNQRYYNSSHAYLKSVYDLDDTDARVNYFTRVIILHHLFAQMDTPSPKKLKGYVQVGALRSHVTAFGIETDAFIRELEALAHGFCVVTEDFKIVGIDDEDLVALGPAGHVHVEMMHNIYYLAAVAEDTWYFNKDTASRIADRIKSPNTQYIASTTYHNALALVEMLQAARSREITSLSSYIDASSFEKATDLTKSVNSITFFEKEIVPPEWIGASARYKIGSVYSGTIQNFSRYGIFVDFETGITGLIPQSAIPANFTERTDIKKGATVNVRIIEADYVAARMSLRLAR